MTAELFFRPRRGERLEADMASMSVEDLKCLMRDLTTELDYTLTRFLPAQARLADANEIEIPDDEPMYVASAEDLKCLTEELEQARETADPTDSDSVTPTPHVTGQSALASREDRVVYGLVDIDDA